MCDGVGCDECDDGWFELTQCATRYIDSYIVTAINMASYADKGILPVAGGLLDQSAWFFNLWMMVDNETKKIEQEQRRERG
jgi:hypothetical protein